MCDKVNPPRCDTSAPTRAVQEGLGVLRQLVVHHQVHIRDVQAAGCHISGHQHHQLHEGRQEHAAVRGWGGGHAGQAGRQAAWQAVCRLCGPRLLAAAAASEPQKPSQAACSSPALACGTGTQPLIYPGQPCPPSCHGRRPGTSRAPAGSCHRAVRRRAGGRPPRPPPRPPRAWSAAGRQECLGLRAA